MQSRRALIAALGSGGATILAGCASSEPDIDVGASEETTSKPKSVGNAVQYDGIRVGISRPFTTQKQLAYNSSSALETQTQTPTEGGTYLFYHVAAENIGENERAFPEGDEMTLYLNGEEAGNEHSTVPGASVIVGGKRYESYIRKLYKRDADVGVNPGVKIGGWNAHEIPAKADLSNAVLRVEIGEPDSEKDDREFSWRLG